MSDPANGLSPEAAAHYRQVLLMHGSVYGASVCHICGVARCPDWVEAYDRLAAANQLMGDPSQWDARQSRRYR